MALDNSPNLASLVLSQQISPRENHNIRPPQPFDRLAQRAARKDVAEPERLQGVQQHDVQIAGDAAMLEAVVQYDQFRLERPDGLSRRRHPIGVLHVRHVGQQPSQLAGFIVFLAGLRPISTADDRHANAASAKPRGEPLDQGRLARAAERKVADAHHRNAYAMDGGRTAVVAAVSPADGGGIKALGNPQDAAQRRRPGAAPPPTHKFSKPRCIEQSRLHGQGRKSGV